MKKERDYTQDIAEIRSMMERSSKFMSLSGWAGVMAGIYALAGAWIVYAFFGFNPDGVGYGTGISGGFSSNLPEVVAVAIAVLILAVGTAVLLSRKKAAGRGEKVWNPTSRRMVVHMAVPLVAGGIFILALLAKNLVGLIAPSTLLFYGMALYSAGTFTYGEVKVLGIIQMGLGLLGSWFIGYGLLLWATGFGLVHIVYGIYMHFRYER